MIDERFVRLRGAHVLIVDDSATARGVLHAVLEAQQLDVVTAGEGGEALAHIARRVPDLIITDGVMPGVDGPALVRSLRENPATSRVPVIALTSGDPKDWQGDHGGPIPDAILTKSPHIDAFLDLVSDLLTAHLETKR